MTAQCASEYQSLNEVTDAEHLFADRDTQRQHSIKWIHTINAPPLPMRIEAVLSGQRVAASPTSNLTHIVAVQPVADSGAAQPSYLTPKIHDVVVDRKPETRTRRMGRLSRQFMVKYLYRSPEIRADDRAPYTSSACPVCCGLDSHCSWFFSTPVRQPRQLFMC